MVMEASPSPQSVGREFVRQYYTLLNKAPSHLHRFYNNQSSFVHGGLDAPNRETNPAIGQKQIHQKIQQLNFRDCHAKISQVDSQATLGNGVVVQVTGELSNAGQPMRRFTQTFVLAAQAPKTYYVHNDIFRYQDLGFPDEEEGEVESGELGISEGVGDRDVDEGGRSEPEEDEQPNQGQQIPLASAPLEEQGPPSIISTQQAQIQQQQHVYYASPPQQAVHPVMQTVAINGSVHDESPLINQLQHTHTYIPETAAQEQFVQEPEPEPVPEPQIQEQDDTQSPAGNVQEQPDQDLEPNPSLEPQPEVPLPLPNTANSGPKTYAGLVKSFANATGTTSPQAPKFSMSPPPISNQRQEDRVPVMNVTTSGPILSTPSSIPPNQQQTHRGISGSQQQQQQPPQQQQQQQHQQQRAPRGGPVQRGMGRGPPRPPFPSDDNGWDGERRGGRPSQYSDQNQLFLGNLPLDASEDQLKQLFEQYGPVADLRVHSKQNERTKTPHGSSNTNRVPNYGFITFEDHQAVLNVLRNLPIHFPDENGTKLNVEEKKVRPRMSMEGGGGGGGGGGGRTSTGDGSVRPMGGQQQRGPGGPGGVMRGSGQPGTRGGRGSFTRGGEGGRGGSMRQPGNHNYQNRR